MSCWVQSSWLENSTVLLCAKADKMFMRTVQQIVFLVLNSVPVTCVTYPELIRLCIFPVMMHSLDQKEVMARKAKARKYTVEIVGNM